MLLFRASLCWCERELMLGESKMQGLEGEGIFSESKKVRYFSVRSRNGKLY